MVRTTFVVGEAYGAGAGMSINIWILGGGENACKTAVIHVESDCLSCEKTEEGKGNRRNHAPAEDASGRQFTGHYRDQIEPFMNGEKRYWWFSDGQIADHKKAEQTLAPR